MPEKQNWLKIWNISKKRRYLRFAYHFYKMRSRTLQLPLDALFMMKEFWVGDLTDTV